MKITLTTKQQKFKTIGSTEEGLCVPRIGESINLGYSPWAVVTDVYYDFDAKIVWVLVDGLLGI